MNKLARRGSLFITAIVAGMIFIFGARADAGTGMIRMAGSDWPVWETAHGMSALGQLKSFDFSYEKYAVCIDSFIKGKFDATFMTVYDFIAAQRENPNGVIIAVQDYSNGGDGIVLHPEITSAQALKGKALGLPTEAISLYLVNLYLIKNGLSLNDVTLTNVPGEFVSKAYAANAALAGIAGWNPNLGDAVKAGGKLVATSADFPEIIFDCIVANKESLKNNRPAYVQFLKDWFKAVNDPAVIAAAAKALGSSVDDVTGGLADAHIYTDAKSSLAMFPKLKEVAAQVQAFYTVKPSSVTGRTQELFGNKPLNIDGLFDDSLLKEIAPDAAPFKEPAAKGEAK